MLETHQNLAPGALTVGVAVREGTSYLRRNRVRCPRLDAELMLGSILGHTRAYLLSHPELCLGTAQAAKWARWLRKRGEHYPVQYLLESQEFYGRSFAVGPGVLIPRPETELLVDTCLEWLDGMVQDSPRILDVGTGSGVIAVTLAAERRQVRVTATDISGRALAVAKMNAARHGCESRVEFLQGRNLVPLAGRVSRWDLVVSNPPYVSTGARGEVDRSVIKYEPGEAVFAEKDGMAMYEALLGGCSSLLEPGSPLVLEIDSTSQERVCRLARRRGWHQVDARKDLAGRQRCLVFVPGELGRDGK